MAGTHNSGRRRKPAVIRKAEGKRGHRPIPEEPEPSGHPQLPTHLGPAERVVWTRVMATMPKGVITAADEAILEAYCSAVVTWREADAMIHRSGLMVRGPEGQPTQNPLLRVRNRAFGENAGRGDRARPVTGCPNQAAKSRNQRAGSDGDASWHGCRQLRHAVEQSPPVEPISYFGPILTRCPAAPAASPWYARPPPGPGDWLP